MALKDDLDEAGIVWERSPPYTQHANGVAERMIRSINTKARSWMLEGEVPDFLWGEAVRCACYVHRLLPQRGLGGKSPFELHNGHSRAPSIKHLRVFGSLAYRWLAPEQREKGKWTARASPSMMVGYGENSKTNYRLYDFLDKRVHEASSVTFREDIKAWPEYGTMDVKKVDDLFGEIYSYTYEDDSDEEEQDGTHPNSPCKRARAKSHTQAHFQAQTLLPMQW